MCAVEYMLCGMWVGFAEGADGIGQMCVLGCEWAGESEGVED